MSQFCARGSPLQRKMVFVSGIPRKGFFLHTALTSVFSLKEQQANDGEKKPCFDISGTFYWCQPTRFENVLLVCWKK